MTDSVLLGDLQWTLLNSLDRGIPSCLFFFFFLSLFFSLFDYVLCDHKMSMPRTVPASAFGHESPRRICSHLPSKSPLLYFWGHTALRIDSSAFLTVSNNPLFTLISSLCLVLTSVSDPEGKGQGPQENCHSFRLPILMSSLDTDLGLPRHPQPPGSTVS